jgi:hypothetical protein
MGDCQEPHQKLVSFKPVISPILQKIYYHYPIVCYKMHPVPAKKEYLVPFPQKREICPCSDKSDTLGNMSGKRRLC